MGNKGSRNANHPNPSELMANPEAAAVDSAALEHIFYDVGADNTV